jgi:hypothetical protein
VHILNEFDRVMCKPNFPVPQSWPLAKALPAATEDAIAEFIFHEIYMHYGAPQEIFTDGGKNLWGRSGTEVPRQDQDDS